MIKIPEECVTTPRCFSLSDKRMMALVAPRILKAPDSRDGRVKLAGLTKKGIKIIDKAIELRFSEASQAVCTLSKTEKISLAKLLKKVLISM